VRPAAGGAAAERETDARALVCHDGRLLATLRRYTRAARSRTRRRRAAIGR
jgi:hypothetical protein